MQRPAPLTYRGGQYARDIARALAFYIAWVADLGGNPLN